MKKPIRIPTDAEFSAYLGEHCFALWRKVGPAWICPGCGRNKRQITRWTKRAPRPRARTIDPVMGWMAGLCTHHCHSSPVWKWQGRFEPVVICDHCNSADAQAKLALKLPDNFSFSADEIRQFIVAAPHASHQLRLDVALRLFKATRAGVTV
jgi:hypothetical protein